jgi:hypothetical protein
MNTNVFGALVLALLIGACGPKYGEPLVGVSAPDRATSVAFSFRTAGETTAAKRIGTEQFLGQPALLVFVTTDDLVAQAQLVALARAEREMPFGVPVIAVFVVEKPQEELVPSYARTLDLPFVLAIADDETRAGGAPFSLAAVPTLVLLDGGAHVAWKNPGVAHPNDVRKQIALLKGGK